jgi:L-alanine-DL-glutamate epimerase-like enolase superfamily enzyme
MKITNVQALCLSRPHEPGNQWITTTYRTVKADCAIIVISTDSGLTGIGEAAAYGWPLKIRQWIEWLKTTLIGKSPTDLSIVPSPNGQSRAYDCAVAGIDCALWDLRGQIAGKPIAQLLNPDAESRVRLYASSGCRYDWNGRPEQLIDEVISYAEQGMTACKIRIGTEWSWAGITVDRFLDLMRDLVSATEGKIELMVDGNQRLAEDQALSIAKELERLGFIWFEEPIPQTDVDGYSRLNAAVEMAITGGERFTTLEQFRVCLEKKAYDIVQPDAGLTGITETMKIAEMAFNYGVDFCPHSWHNGLMAMANGHLVAASPNPRVLELCMIQGPLQWEILADKPIIKDGWLHMPDRPGMGVILADNLEEKFPHIEGHYAVIVER